MNKETAGRDRVKCAVSDFDRTLYVDEQVSPRNLAAVRAWQAAGNKFVLATGRNETSVRVKLEEAGLEPDALILNNGAVILDGDGRELFCRTIDPDTVREVLTFLHNYNDDGSGVSTRTKKVNVLSSALTTTQKPCDGDLTFDQIDQLHDVVQIHRRKVEDREEIRLLCQELNERFPDISAYANVWNADIVAKGVDKSAAIGWLERYWGGFDEMIVVGDSANDIRMIKEYHGAAMEHADEEVRSVASSVVKDVAEALKKD